MAPPHWWSYRPTVCGAPHLVEVEDQVELAHVVEVLVENLHKVVDCLQIHQVVVGDVDADTEVESGIAAVHDLEVTELQTQ